jgi:hypothetical protein
MKKYIEKYTGYIILAIIVIVIVKGEWSIYTNSTEYRIKKLDTINKKITKKEWKHWNALSKQQKIKYKELFWEQQRRFISLSINDRLGKIIEKEKKRIVKDMSYEEMEMKIMSKLYEMVIDR